MALTTELENNSKRYIRTIAKNADESYYINIPQQIIKAFNLKQREYLQIFSDDAGKIYMEKVELK